MDHTAFVPQGTYVAQHRSAGRTDFFGEGVDGRGAVAAQAADYGVMSEFHVYGATLAQMVTKFGTNLA